MKVRFELRLKSSFYKNDIAKLTKAAEGIPTSAWLPDFSQKFLKVLNDVSRTTDKLDYNRFGWLKNDDITIINSMSIPLGGDKDASFASLPPLNGYTLKPKGTYSFLEKLLMVLVIVCGTILSLLLYFHFRLRKQHDDLYMEKMAYKATFERVGFGGGGGNTRKLIGKMWTGVKNAIKKTSPGERDTGDIEEEEEGTSFVNRPRRDVQGTVANSLQSMSSILTSATNPRHNDTHNSHRNYNSNYRYNVVNKDEQDGIELSNAGDISTPDLVIADEDDVIGSEELNEV